MTYPRSFGGEAARHDRTYSGANQPSDGHIALVFGPRAEWEEVGKDDICQDDEATTTDALESPTSDKSCDVVGHGADDRAEREHEERAIEDGLTTKGVGKRREYCLKDGGAQNE